jgi:mono/diheme cytochrome c family protein
VLVLGLVGCSNSQPPQFRLNREGQPTDAMVRQEMLQRAENRRAEAEELEDAGKDDEAEAAETEADEIEEGIDAEIELLAHNRQDLVNALEAVFGTPDEPYDVNQWIETGLDHGQVVKAAGPVRQELSGGQRGLYREHCAHCHGISGDGAGPTAAFLRPYPRDYRKGVFKFTSTAAGMRPTLNDLKNILRHGIPGTAMPSFALLPEDEIDALAQYVRYLAIRGETETLLAAILTDRSEGDPLTRELIVGDDGALTGVALAWREAEFGTVQPPPPLMLLADSNEDGRLELDEILTHLAANFELLDADGDGLLNLPPPGALKPPDVGAAAVEEGADDEEPAADAPPAVQAAGPVESMGRLVPPEEPLDVLEEALEDLAVSRAEALDFATEEVFDLLDVNRDGFLFGQELEGRWVSPDPAIDSAADANEDLQLSPDEVEAFAEAQFEQADADGEEGIDDVEYRDFNVAAGAVLYQNAERAQCVKCHGPTGLGDGGEVRFDAWNEAKVEALKRSSPEEVAAMFTLPLQELKPRNLRLGVYRGGHRPVDLYRRMHAGIKGAQMPNFGPSPGNLGVLRPEEIWQLLEFVRSLPFEAAREPAPQPAHVARQGN